MVEAREIEEGAAPAPLRASAPAVEKPEAGPVPPDADEHVARVAVPVHEPESVHARQGRPQVLREAAPQRAGGAQGIVDGRQADIERQARGDRFGQEGMGDEAPGAPDRGRGHRPNGGEVVLSQPAQGEELVHLGRASHRVPLPTSPRDARQSSYRYRLM